jgi:SRSO17 transposase
MERIRLRFTRHEPWRHAGALMLGLCSDLGRKNCWTIAERAGHASPDRLQHLLARACWDADAVRDDLREYVVEHLGHPEAVLVVDETGDVKKGSATVGVQRQYTGTAGRIENAQVAVYLAYAAGSGHALIDRALYLPKSWIEDPGQRERAGVPQDVQFATKPALAAEMIIAALDAGVPAGWVAGDEVYGADPTLRQRLEERGVGYVLAIGCNRKVTTATGSVRVDQLAAGLEAAAWARHSAGAGAKGQRWYSWAAVHLTEPGPGQASVLIRRNETTGELAYYRCYSPHSVPLASLVRVAGQRWKIEESFQTSKGLTGLDEHQVRRWTSWHRWTTLAMLAHAFLTISAATERSLHTAPAGLIPLTVNEFRKLFEALLLAPIRATTAILDWSRWRRKHQARARISHYNRRTSTTEPDLRL